MVRHKKGHKNSNGELAEWVIVSHKDGHIISSHKTKAEAEKHLGDIRKFKYMGESMQLEEAKELLENEGYIINENYYGVEIEKHTVADEQEQDVYHGRVDGFWWSITAGFAMSKSDRSGKSKQYKVYAGKLGEPKTRKCLATKANFSNVFEIIADYLNKLKAKNESYITESFKDDLIAAFTTQCGETVWRKYYDRIMKNPEMAQYAKDAQADGMSADEIVEYLLDWDEHLNEDFTQGVGAPLGADQGIPHSMQGCAVPMMRLGEPAPYGKIQKCGPRHPMHHHRPGPGLYLFGSTVNLLNYGKKRKSKKKKRKKK